MNNKQYSRIALYFFVEDLTDPHKTTARLVSGMAHLNIESHVEVLHLIPISRSAKMMSITMRFLIFRELKEDSLMIPLKEIDLWQDKL